MKFVVIDEPPGASMWEENEYHAGDHETWMMRYERP